MADNRSAVAYGIATGHAFNKDAGKTGSGKHIEEFRDPSLGPIIKVFKPNGEPDFDKMKNYIEGLFVHPDTYTFTKPDKPPIQYI